jgi:tryptophanyl-tRNA synthetase
MADVSTAAAELAAAALTDPAPAADGAPQAGEQVVTPWDVQGGAGGIDYDKLLTTFGCQPINPDLIARCVCCSPCFGLARR